MRAELAVSEAERVELARRARQLVRRSESEHLSLSKCQIPSVCCCHFLCLP